MDEALKAQVRAYGAVFDLLYGLAPAEIRRAAAVHVDLVIEQAEAFAGPSPLGSDAFREQLAALRAQLADGLQ